MIGNHSTTSTMQPIESTRVTKMITDSTTTHFAPHSKFSSSSTMQLIEPTRVTQMITGSMTTHFAPHSKFSSSTTNMEQNQMSTNPPDQSTTGSGSVQPQSDPLLAIILGTVGGLITLLLFAIVLLLIIIAVRKKHTPQSSGEDR